MNPRTAFYLARRYLFFKKGTQAVSFITWLAGIAMMVAVMAMFIIVSVFAGLEEMNQDTIQNLHADLNIKPSSGKVLPRSGEIRSWLKARAEVQAVSGVIEEKVYASYGDAGDVAVLRGIEPNYTHINPLNRQIYLGKYLDFRYHDEILMEIGLANRLSVPLGETTNGISIMMPKAGTGIIQRQEDAFETQQSFVSGIFSGNDLLNNYIICPLEMSRTLLNLSPHSVYQLVAKLKDPTKAEDLQAKLQQKFGKQIQVTTKEQENAAFWKIIHLEKLMVYLIFGLVILITTFNLAGALVIIQLDKQSQARTLVSLGLSLRGLRQVYFYTGMLIVLLGSGIGLALGTVVVLLQKYFGMVQASEFIPFPVRILPETYAIVAMTSIGFGLLVSWIFSRVRNTSLRN